MKVYQVLGLDDEYNESFGLYLHQEKAEEEAQRLQGLLDKWHDEGIDPPKEDKDITWYGAFKVVTLEVKE